MRGVCQIGKGKGKKREKWAERIEQHEDKERAGRTLGRGGGHTQVAGQSMKYQQGEERETTAEKDVRSRMVNRFNSLPSTRRRQ